MIQASSPAHHPEVGTTGDDEALPVTTMRTIPSALLLEGRTCVTIDHEGVSYILRTTRAGKLILTK